ncbi:aldehyde reductase [Leptospira sp. 2 VSF19]|uniref:Aldehyde reductase n=1 Tax=Leptospira soteropolitanensis TaxID=2950025 RepID=A0AAW5VJP3_9LEPT|nr:aldehyde reductase [Leptospira soteropolitanensis]MCW7491258.1 aldehyde reductase [Leptospira soteropolitanensis]MCW7498843.1 aldehyde reductase [Leptospira soteropolitanensis]MCW7521565.1 aldehyde reductase [Leptospira soteropolitanensis]MCW7524946.1 aldehyde reductase [Leptospira soteropolitanensis]MCW7528814.1 aldehyde reductase [Leptospira soteropolitanensis]
MKSINSELPIVVTGGSGYIASWIVKYLLEDGKAVRATVRSLKDLSKIEHLLELKEKYKEKLNLFEADLMLDGSFDKVIADTELVIHTASPFFVAGVKDAKKQLIDPALQGTKNVLESCNRISSVKRVVLTSSVAAIYGDNIDSLQVPNQTFTEEHWNTTSNLSHQPYAYSKTLAEKEAWEIQKRQSRWDLVVINPSFVMGPSLSKRMDGTSVEFMKNMLKGVFRTGVPDTKMGFVDFRDVAKAHILAGLTPSAEGRHITSAEVMPMLGVAKIIKEFFGNKYSVPTGTLPKALVYVIGPFFGLSWGYTKNNIGQPLQLNNEYSKTNLRLIYRPLTETIVDHVNQMESSGLL